ncbi:unnamed protein product [Toxocara canis]|uniref:DUF3475 domain-containing protein n=1 Tax=Toxocara canis TaxID=6265 RepID=A0A183UMH1_TOXCA|nr:unnamed protein product [Toxocara canis]
MGNPKSFDEDSHMDLNYLVAAVGGAKLLVDQVRTTRSTTQRLVSCCGLKEEEFLYNGLNRSHTESKAIEDLSNNRQSSMVESFVDFQKQIQFKMVVLDLLAEKFADCISDSYPRAKKKQVKKTLFKTPLRKGHISPLNSDRIVESYAFEVASKIADQSRKRKVAGIPFNIHLLDDGNE